MHPAIRIIIPVLLGMVIWFAPVPQGLQPNAWQIFAIFMFVIAGLLLRPMPLGVMALSGVVLTVALGVLKLGEAVGGFATSFTWLIISAFLFARGFTKTGLGKRIAYIIIGKLGDSTLKLGYAMALTNLVVAPVTPSNTARVGGILYPIVRNIALTCGSEPETSPRKVGAYLIYTTFASDACACALFMTAMAGNVVSLSLAQATASGFQLSWMEWCIASSVPCLLMVAILPYLIFKLYPPETLHTPQAKEISATELQKLGPMTRAEICVALVFVSCILLWSTSALHKIDATTVALLGVIAMLWSRALDWDDLISEKGAWDTMIWMGGLVCIASYMAKFGLFKWFSGLIAAPLQGIPWELTIIVLLLLYLYTHYFFASATAHITAMLAALVTVALASGAPVFMATFPFIGMGALIGTLTYYGTGPGPILYGARYVEDPVWFKLGFIVASLNLVIWIVVGSLWWKVLGYW